MFFLVKIFVKSLRRCFSLVVFVKNVFDILYNGVILMWLNWIFGDLLVIKWKLR